MYYIGIDSGLYGYKSGLETSYISNCADVQGIFTGQSVTKNKSVGWENIFGYHQLNYKIMCVQRPLCSSLKHRSAAEAPHFHVRS